MGRLAPSGNMEEDMRKKGVAFGAGALFLAALLFAGMKTGDLLHLEGPAQKAGIEAADVQDTQTEESVELRAELTKEDLQELQEQKEACWEDYFSLTTEYTGIYSQPDYDAEQLTAASEQTRVLVTGNDDGWCAVTSGTVSGYIPEQALLSKEKAWEYLETYGIAAYESLPEAVDGEKKQRLARQSVNELIAQGRKDEEEREKKKQQQEEQQLAYEERLDRMFGGEEAQERPVPYQKEETAPAADEEAVDPWTDAAQPADEYGEDADGIQVVSYALQFVGNPYVYGGTSLTDGCDCSGFVQSVYRRFSIELPRTSREQATVGTRVDFYDLQPGDLLFYINDGTTIGHVAMYIGGGRIVQAYDEEHGIVISEWNYRMPCLAKRVL